MNRTQRKIWLNFSKFHAFTICDKIAKRGDRRIPREESIRLPEGKINLSK